MLADELIGRPSVIDGDTIEIAGKRIRLHGIDAPEGWQTCLRDSKPVRCGQEAAWALADRIGSSIVACDDRGRDRYGRVISVCHLGSREGPDLNAWMVEQGWALAYRHYSLAYVGEEAAAQAARRGLWSGSFKAPWDWRRERRQPKTE